MCATPNRQGPALFLLLRDYWQLIRPGILGMVLFTLAVAALIARPEVPSWPVIAHALVGSGLLIAGALALNQRIEHRSDAAMRRTRRRPLPSGRLSARHAAWFGAIASTAGLAYLAAFAEPAVVVIGLASWVVYVWLYTPMKMLSAWQTPLGALSGAMPILMGAAAAGEARSLTGLTLFGILYFWQFPHAMAIAWLYREDFAAARLKVASVIDPTGRTAAVVSLAGAMFLVPISLLSTFSGRTGWGYMATAIVAGVVYLACAMIFFRCRDDRTARWLLRASLIYLPAVCIALLVATL